MKSSTLRKNDRRLRRQRHVRRRIRDHSELPRLCVFRSCKHIYAQVIDDVKGATLIHVSSAGKSAGSEMSGKTKTERSALVGSAVAQKAKEAGIEKVVFDRGFSKYHGRVKALADAAREGGLKF